MPEVSICAVPLMVTVVVLSRHSVLGQMRHTAEYLQSVDEAPSGQFRSKVQAGPRRDRCAISAAIPVPPRRL